IGRAEPLLRASGQGHYARAAARTHGADPREYEDRAERQVRSTLAFLPRYAMLGGVHVFGLGTLASLWRRGHLSGSGLRPARLGLTLCDLLGFGAELNPTIAAADDRPEVPVIEYLRREVGSSGRALGIGEELPPNTLMRYKLADVRNYDSIELTTSVE